MVPYLVELMQDPYTAVRYIAQRSLRTHGNYTLTSYDFLAGADDYKAACDVVLQLWKSRDQVVDPNRASAILLDAAGHVLHEEFTRLLERRDHREIILSE